MVANGYMVDNFQVKPIGPSYGSTPARRLFRSAALVIGHKEGVPYAVCRTSGTRKAALSGDFPNDALFADQIYDVGRDA